MHNPQHARKAQSGSDDDLTIIHVIAAVVGLIIAATVIFYMWWGVLLLFDSLFGEGPLDFVASIGNLVWFSLLFGWTLSVLSTESKFGPRCIEGSVYLFISTLVPHLYAAYQLADSARRVNQGAEASIYVAERIDWLQSWWYIPQGWWFVGGWIDGDWPTTRMAYVSLPCFALAAGLLLAKKHKLWTRLFEYLG